MRRVLTILMLLGLTMSLGGCFSEVDEPEGELPPLGAHWIGGHWAPFPVWVNGHWAE